MKIGDVIHFVLAPSKEGQITGFQQNADGGRIYRVAYTKDDGGFADGWFAACELIADDSD